MGECGTMSHRVVAAGDEMTVDSAASGTLEIGLSPGDEDLG